MVQGSYDHGFTTVEVLMVLAVSALLLVIGLRFVSGQVSKTAFSQTINDLNTQFTDIMNNVASGYYARNATFNCTSSGSYTAGFPAASPQITSGTNPQGTNAGCVFVGRAVQFNVGGDPTKYNIYNIIARQYADANTQTAWNSWDKAYPMLLSSSTAHPLSVDTTEIKQLSYSVGARTMTYNGGTPTGVIAFMTNPANVTAGNPSSGSQTISIYVFNGVGLNTNNSKNNAVDSLYSAIPGNLFNPNNLIKPSNVSICFDNGDQKATFSFAPGGLAVRNSADLTIGSSPC